LFPEEAFLDQFICKSFAQQTTNISATVKLIIIVQTGRKMRVQMGLAIQHVYIETWKTNKTETLKDMDP